MTRGIARVSKLVFTTRCVSSTVIVKIIKKKTILIKKKKMQNKDNTLF
jgi:hypothetical protein